MGETKPLNPKHELFCQYYVGNYETFGNATKSYAKAYNKNVDNKTQYRSCRQEGYRLLTLPYIIKRIEELLKDLVLNDTAVDAELAFLIMQRMDFSSKMRAISEYNKLKQRITEKAELQINPLEKILEKYGGTKGGGVNDDPGATQAESRPSQKSARD